MIVTIARCCRDEMKYETSAEECKFDKRQKVKNRGSYLEDNCHENSVIEKTIVNMW